MKKSIHIVFLFIASLAHANELDSLKKIIDQGKKDTIAVKCMNQYARAVWKRGSFQDAMHYAEMAEKLSLQLNYLKGYGESQTNKGIVYYDQGRYPEALSYYYKALKIFEKINDKKSIAKMNNNLGTVFEGQQEHDKALTYYQKALRLKQEIKDEKGSAGILANIGNIYISKGDYPKGLEYHFKSLGIKKKYNDLAGIGASMNNLGIIYREIKDYPKALEYFKQSLEIRTKTGNQFGIALSYNNLGETTSFMKRYAESKEYFVKGRELAKKLGAIILLKEGYSAESRLYEYMGDYKNAMDSYKLAVIYGDSILNDENTKRSVQSQMQYDFEKKQTADSISNAEHVKQGNLKHDHEIKQQQLYTIGGAIGFILMLIVAGVSFSAFRNKQKANEIIQMQKEIVEDKQKEVLDSIHYAKRIQQSLLPSEKYIQRNLKKLNKN